MKIFTFLLTTALFISSFIIPSHAQEALELQAPEIDGKITDREWLGAKVFTDFHMMIPKSPSKDYDSTIVYIKQDKEALYFAFKFWPKGKVVSKSLIRDRSTEDENEFFIVIDLENKNQNGYIFAFSFLNNQRDMLVYNQRNKSSEWDWVWEAKSRIHREAKNGVPGYIETEVRIPVDKIQNKNKNQIGIDLHLFAYTPDGNYQYYSLIPDSELLSVAKMYKFDLRVPFDEKINLNFNATPFIVGDKFNDSTYNARFGGEFNVSLDKHKLKATLNTDESTLEADPFRFNFYNNPIFLQEKRTFFSKDLDLYNTPINLFYTRAIDTISYGFNYTYRSDNLKGGAIFVEGESDTSGNREQFFITRPYYEGKDFKIGGLFVYHNDKVRSIQERVFSLDGFYRFPSNPLRFGAQIATDTKAQAMDFYGYYQYNDNGGPYGDISYIRVDREFSLSTFYGGAPVRNNYDEFYFGGGYNFVYNRKYFSDINLNIGYFKSKTLHQAGSRPGGFVFQERYSVNTNYKVTDWLRFNQHFQYNRPNDFDESGNLIVRTNTLQEYTANFYLGNNSMYAGYFFGPYFGSFIKNPYAGVNLFFFEKVAVNASVSYFDFFSEKRTILNTRLDYRILPGLYLRTFFQKDTFSKQALWNTLVQYEFFAGSNAYFVLNLEGERLQNTRRYFKVGYEFNF